MISPTNEKTPDRMPQKHVRRFPENNITSNANNNNTTTNNNNVSSTKSEMSSHHRNVMDRDSEHNDRKMHSLLSTSLLNSANIRKSEPDPTSPPTIAPRRINSNPLQSTTDDSSASSSAHLMNYMSSQTISETKVSQFIVSKEMSTTSMASKPSTAITEALHNNDNFVNKVLENGEYLLKYDSWHEFRGTDEIKKCSKKVIERNENIWELVAIEYRHIKLLVNIRDVYCKSYPYIETGSSQMTAIRTLSTYRTESSSSIETKDPVNVFESIDVLLPGIDHLIECHAKICDCLINNHVIRPDRVITEIGSVLHESIPDTLIPTLAELYGDINYAKQYIQQKLAEFKKYPVFNDYILKCERNPKCGKKTLADVLLHISTHWSKKVTALNSIIVNTINDSHDLHKLMTFKERIDKIVNEASNVMDDRMHRKLLQSLVDNYEHTDIEDSDRVLKFMRAPNAKLIFNGKVQFELRRSNNGKPLLREVHGVALEDCIFFLQTTHEPGKTCPKYQLFSERDSKFPALLEWGKLYGYFREENSKNSNTSSFYVIIEKPKPAIVRLFVATPLDRNNWKKCMMQGFSRWQTEASDIKEAENQLNEEMKKIEKKWSNTQFGIELIKNLDNSLRVQLEYRTVGFRCILEEELKRLTTGSSVRGSIHSVTTVTESDHKLDDIDSNNPVCTETFLPDLTTQEGIHDWLEVFMEWVNRLKFSLCSSGANITRSASEIEARKRPSIPTVKKCDTFSSRDSPNYVEKRQTDVTFLNPPITKLKKDQRRISVSGFTNLFRINSKTAKPDDGDKTYDPTSGTTDCTLEYDKDNNMALSNLEMITESDCFLSSLSKDTVAAFTAINDAAKNITVELINLRTQNMSLEAELKKIQEENQSFREFLRKYQKSTGDCQSGLMLGSIGQQKSDSVNNSLGVAGLNTPGSSDQIAELLESLNENSAGFAHTNQNTADCRIQNENLRQMVEKFQTEKKKWEKEYENQRRKNENETESIFQKNLELQKEKASLIERDKKYKENCLNLQKKIDIYNRYGINLEDEPHNDGTTISISKTQQIQQIQQLHSRSQSDESSHKVSSRQSAASLGPLSPPLASTEATLYNAEQHGHGNTDPKHSSHIPDQLRGSLINQERQTIKTNSSDNIQESKGKVCSSSAPKPKLTPSIDRKEHYSSSNTCYTTDDKDDSDIEDLRVSNNAAVRSSTFDHVETRQTITSTTVKTVPSTGDNNNNQQSSVTRSNTAPPPTIVKSPGLEIPFSLASKTKVKKDKSRKSKIL